MSKVKDKFDVCKTKVKAAGKRAGEFIEEHPAGVVYGSLLGLMGVYLGLCYKSGKKQNQELVDGLIAKGDVKIDHFVDKRKGGVTNYILPEKDE